MFPSERGAPLCSSAARRRSRRVHWHLHDNLAIMQKFRANRSAFAAFSSDKPRRTSQRPWRHSHTVHAVSDAAVRWQWQIGAVNMLNMLIDITDRNQIEQTLRKQARRLGA
jgi:hypothetical protein